MTDRPEDRSQPLLKRRRRELVFFGAIPAAAVLLCALAGAVSFSLALLLIAVLTAAGILVEHWNRPAWQALEMPAATPAVAGTSPPAPAAVAGPGFGSAARALLDELPDAILVVDAEGRLVTANRAARMRFVGNGYERKFLSATMRRPAVLEAVQRVRDTAKAEEAEFSELVPVERSFVAYVAPLAHEDGAAPDVLVAVRDLTAIKAVEKMRADFVANASHELRTPLSSLIGFIETLRGHARDDAEARERFLEIMQEQAGRMGRLIDDLLSLSRIELNEHVAPQGAVDLKSVVFDVCDALQPLARDARVALRPQFAPDLMPVTGSRDELVQVLQNLLDNALKYGPADSQIEITAGPGAPAGITGLIGPSCYVTVTDHGEGIAREHIPRLTERFYRVDVKRSRERGGTGLGLAIVKHIVSRHRGKLHIKSEAGLGSSFTVLLPAHAAEPAAPQAAAPEPGSEAAAPAAPAAAPPVAKVS